MVPMNGYTNPPMPMPMATPSAPMFASPDTTFGQASAAMDFRQHVNRQLGSCTALTEDEVHSVLETYVAGNCCYGDGFIKEMAIKDLLPTPIYVYDLEMFIEKRTKEWVTEPYRGEYLAHEGTFGVPVDFWAVPIPPPVRFGTAKHALVVPGSTSVVNCAQCTGIGNVQCGTCAGSMSTTCSDCNGTGTQDVTQQDGTTRRVKCIKCKGLRRTSCDMCKGKGTATCKSCQGFRRVKNYEKMDVTWTTVVDHAVHKEGGQIEVTKLKFGTLAKVKVAEACSPGPQDILPFTMFRPFLDTKYGVQCALPHQRVLEIRQNVHSYEATEVICTRKSRDHRFLIYGQEKHVYFPKGYPQACCTIA